MADVLSEPEKAYLAGILDGEGHIGMTTITVGRSYTVKISLGMSDFQIPLLFKETFGGNVYYKDKQSYWNPKWKPQALWSVKSRQAERVLIALLPYLRVKKVQAELALEYMSLVTPGRGTYLTEERLRRVQMFRDQFKILNMKGRITT